MRLIRSREAEWNMDTNRIGVLGFSAGGEVAALLVYNSAEGNPNAPDSIDRIICRANFQMIIYPGPLGIPDEISADVPPAFFVVADDDVSHVGPVMKQVEMYQQVHRPVEVHIHARGGHGFNMGNRSKLRTIKGWPERMTDWMADNNVLNPTVPAPNAK